MKIKKLTNTAIIPTRGSDKAAGYDLYADTNEVVKILPHKTKKISTGLAIMVPEGYYGAIFARSGLSTKKGLRPANCTGVIDSDYRGDVIVALHNDSEEVQTIEPHERIAQLVISPYLPVNSALAISFILSIPSNFLFLSTTGILLIPALFILK